MKTLIIDNYDSFTFNLFQSLAKINGIEPIVVRHDQAPWDRLQRLDFDNAVISPGPGRPDRAADFGVCAEAIRRLDRPLLGVCLGCQGIGYAYGAKIEPAMEAMHGRLSRVRHNGDPLFDGIAQDFAAVRYHSLTLGDALPPCLERIAWTKDGVLMGLRHRRLPFWGVQFHPESICTEGGERLLRNFQKLTEAHWRSPLTARPGNRAWHYGHSVTPASGEIRPANTNAFRLFTRTLELALEPERVFVGRFSGQSTAFWLDNAAEPMGGRFSFMGDANGPHAMTVFYESGGGMRVTHGGKVKAYEGSLWRFLSERLQLLRLQDPDLPFDFQCGFVGYLGYEMKGDCGFPVKHRATTPDAAFIMADRVIALDHETRKVHLVCLDRESHLARANAWLDDTEAALKELGPLAPIELGLRETPNYHWRRPRKRHLEDIEACQRLIASGESYEVCLTNQAVSACQIDPLAYYRALRRMNPAPHAALLRFGDWAVASSSPERFLRLDRDGVVEARPIKGTRPRGESEVEADRLGEQLRASEKERAEHLMIVDLLRNDLGKVCQIGSVTVPELMVIERHPTVHQMVSTVRGRLRPGLEALDCVRAAFPGGSMTGAPKRRTLEIIDEIEGAARGVYSGALGYFSLNGAMDLSIVIRTAVIEPDQVSIGSGGAIVALSDPESELEETALKAKAPLAALAQTARQKKRKAPRQVETHRDARGAAN